jgi:nicotinate-nucleotide adenylyltransferase
LTLAVSHTGARRIGVFGGSFDPPHLAHIALARAAVSELKLDELHIIPTGDAWHKARALSPAPHRLAMARLAFADLPGVVVDERELLRAGPSFTIDTLQELQAQFPGSQLHLIIGADQFVAFQKWHRWLAVLEIAIICIADRAISALSEARFDANDELKCRFDAYKQLDARFLVLTLPVMSVSATHIRQLVAEGAGDTRGIISMVPEAVARYISLNQLYLTR